MGIIHTCCALSILSRRSFAVIVQGFAHGLHIRLLPSTSTVRGHLQSPVVALSDLGRVSRRERRDSATFRRIQHEQPEPHGQ